MEFKDMIYIINTLKSFNDVKGFISQQNQLEVEHNDPVSLSDLKSLLQHINTLPTNDKEKDQTIIRLTEIVYTALVRRSADTPVSIINGKESTASTATPSPIEKIDIQVWLELKELISKTLYREETTTSTENIRADDVLSYLDELRFEKNLIEITYISISTIDDLIKCHDIATTFPLANHKSSNAKASSNDVINAQFISIITQELDYHSFMEDKLIQHYGGSVNYFDAMMSSNAALKMKLFILENFTFIEPIYSSQVARWMETFNSDGADTATCLSAVLTNTTQMRFDIENLVKLIHQATTTKLHTLLFDHVMRSGFFVSDELTTPENYSDFTVNLNIYFRNFDWSGNSRLELVCSWLSQSNTEEDFTSKLNQVLISMFAENHGAFFESLNRYWAKRYDGSNDNSSSFFGLNTSRGFESNCQTKTGATFTKKDIISTFSNLLKRATSNQTGSSATALGKPPAYSCK